MPAPPRGHVVAEALRAHGERVVVHDEYFAADAPDVQWLRQVGEKGWVVLTKDARIRTNALERQALLAGESTRPLIRAASAQMRTAYPSPDTLLGDVYSATANFSPIAAQ